jgi:hypothetical protein
MKTYNQLFWNLLILLFIGSIGWFAYETFNLRSTVKELQGHNSATAVGTDSRLQRTVDKLEKTLGERAEFVFRSTSDPLELSRVIISKNIMMDNNAFLKALESKPRLSCLIQGETPKAIIRLKNQNHVVTVGDRFDAYKVTRISETGVRLVTGGRALHLKVEAATKDLARRLADLDFAE